MSENPKYTEHKNTKNDKTSFIEKKYLELKKIIQETFLQKRNSLKWQIDENIAVYWNDILLNPKFKKLIENNNYFFKNHFKFNKEICEWLKLNHSLSISVIERESSFDLNAKSPTWADSYMQLTSNPFEDMNILNKWSRWHLYMKYFWNIPESFVNQIKNPESKLALQKLKSLSAQNNLKSIKKDWNKEITKLESNRADPYINLLIWNIYLHFLKNVETDSLDWEKRIDNELKELKKLISLAKKEQIKIRKNKKKQDWEQITKIEKRFKILLEEKWLNIKIWIPELENLYSKLINKNNVDLRENFYALSRYNGDTNKDTWIAHKIIYAAVVTKAMEHKNINNPKV